MTPLRAFFWKETRERGRGALLAALLMGAAFACSLWMSRNDSGVAFLAPSFLGVTFVGSALAGLLLGLAQSFPERSADRWAFLVHRPLSGSALFFGKVAPGLCLYAVATIPAYLAAAAWAAMPGHFAAPFTPAMLVPGSIDLAGGIVWYLAGLLAGLREARWYGSRFLPLAAAWTVADGAAGAHAAWAALAWIFGGAALLALAAWGTLETKGGLRRLPRAGRLGLFATFALAGQILVTLLGGLLVPLFLPAPPPSGTERDLLFGQDGTVYIHTRDRTDGIETYADLGGKVLDARALGLHEWAKRQDFFASMATLTSDFRLPERGFDEGYQEARRYAVDLSPTSYSQKDAETSWFYVPGQNRLRGYDPKERRAVGENGIVLPERLLRLESMPDTLLFPHAAATFERDAGRLVPLADPRSASGAAPRPVYGVAGLRNRSSRSTRKDADIPSPVRRGVFYAVLFEDEIAFYGRQGNLLGHSSLIHDKTVYNRIHVAKPNDENGGGFFVWYQPRDAEDGGGQTLPSYLVRLDERGQFLSETAIPPVESSPWISSPWDEIKPRLRPLPVMAWETAGVFYHAKIIPETDSCGCERHAWRGIAAHPFREIAAHLANGLAAAALGLLWLAFAGRKTGRGVWSAALVLCGPGALFALPVLAPRERKTKAAPAPSGSEIFEKEPEPV